MVIETVKPMYVNITTVKLDDSNKDLSRHCFPIRPGKDLAIVDHFLGPCFAINSMILSSSCATKPIDGKTMNNHIFFNYQTLTDIKIRSKLKT